jgi:hypothetical protein
MISRKNLLKFFMFFIYWLNILITAINCGYCFKGFGATDFLCLPATVLPGTKDNNKPLFQIIIISWATII